MGKRKPTIQQMGAQALQDKIKASGKTVQEYYATLQKKATLARKRNAKKRDHY